jgi:hypothetical protein
MSYQTGFIVKVPVRIGYDPTERPSPYPNTDKRRAYMRKYMAERRALEREERRG